MSSSDRSLFLHIHISSHEAKSRYTRYKPIATVVQHQQCSNMAGISTHLPLSSEYEGTITSISISLSHCLLVLSMVCMFYHAQGAPSLCLVSGRYYIVFRYSVAVQSIQSQGLIGAYFAISLLYIHLISPSKGTILLQ